MLSLGSYLWESLSWPWSRSRWGSARIGCGGGCCRRGRRAGAARRGIVAVALLIWIVEVLGTFGLFYAGRLVAAALLVAGTMVLWPAGPVAAGIHPPFR